MSVAILDYNAGNIRSVVNAVKRLGYEPQMTNNPDELRRAAHVIIPGEGEAKTTMAYLKAHQLDEVIRSLKQPVLGICIGQQLFCEHSEEGDVDCLGIFPVEVKQFRPTRHEDKVPHMGWNTLTELKSPLYEGIKEEAFVYFIHSYYVPLNPFTIATTDYIQPFSASLCRDNFYSTQFHVEKSGTVGEHILQNFLQL